MIRLIDRSLVRPVRWLLYLMLLPLTAKWVGGIGLFAIVAFLVNLFEHPAPAMSTEASLLAAALVAGWLLLRRVTPYVRPGGLRPRPAKPGKAQPPPLVRSAVTRRSSPGLAEAFGALEPRLQALLGAGLQAGKEETPATGG